MAKGFGPYTDYPATALALSLWTSALLVAIARVIEWRNGRPLRNTARFALAFAACAGLIKLLVLFHPDLPIGDALFHAHRFRTVVAGNFLFTSIAPGNYQFPYAPGLYVAAAPFADMVTRDSGDMMLLRIFVVLFDAAAAALLYLMIVRGWGDRLAAAIAVALYHLAPLDLGIATVGNLTNAFAQSLAVFALVVIADPGLRLERRLYVAALAALLAAAYHVAHQHLRHPVPGMRPHCRCVRVERGAGAEVSRDGGSLCLGRGRGSCSRVVLRAFRRDLPVGVRENHRRNRKQRT